jgi:hypothetical protein
MRPEVTDLLTWLRGTGEPEWIALESGAGLDEALPEPRHDVVEPYRWFLDRLGDGVRLTAAGYLPPALVSETMRTLGWDADWIGAGNREDLTLPVAELRETARRLGLVRVYRNELRPTADGKRLRDDPVGLWWHLAARLPLTTEQPAEQAGLLWLLGVAAGRPHAEDVVAAGLGRIGYVSAATGAAPDRHTAFAQIRDTTWTVFARLGLVPSRRHRDQPPAPDAVALARAALRYDPPPPPARPVPAVDLTVTLIDVDPPVWRRIRVPEATTLLQLHGLVQAAMGWDDAHLHLFEFDGVLYGDIEDFAGELGDEWRTRIGSFPDGSVVRYQYDFGDGWEHAVTIDGRGRALAPACLDGAGACPPEDVGGVGGYARLLEALADPAGERDDDDLDAYGPIDPASFDVDEADRRVRRRAGRGRR